MVWQADKVAAMAMSKRFFQNMASKLPAGAGHSSGIQWEVKLSVANDAQEQVRQERNLCRTMHQKKSSPVGAKYAAPTELGKLWRWVSTKMSHLRRWLAVKPGAAQ